MKTAMINRVMPRVKQLPVKEIIDQLVQADNGANASQLFVQLAEHAATSTLVLSARTDDQAMITLHEDFCLQLTVLIKEKLNTSSLLGCPAVLMRLDAGKLVPLHGMIAGFQASRTSSDPDALDIVLASPLHLLKKQRHNRVFVDRSALDIAAQLLRDALGHLCDIHLLADQSAPVAMITQYQETDYDFIRRILARHGMFIHLSQAEERTALYLVNRLSDVPEAKRIVHLPYMTNSGAAKNKDHISHIQQHYALAPSAVSLKDYNPDTGFDLSIAGRSKTGGSAGDTEHWGLNYTTPDEGEQLARRLAAYHYWQSQLLELVTSNAGLLPGHLINITGHAKHNGSYRVIKLAFAADQSSLNNSGATGKEFQCRAWVLPLEVDYVPYCPQRTSLPLALSARITQEVDDQGCYRLRYPFDDRSEEDGYSSPPTRSLQAFGGNRHGMHFPLAESSEVVVSGLNGDLDRPVILGAVFNHDAPDLINRDNARTNLIYTRGGQTLRMEDKPDHEHIQLATPEDKNRLLLDATRDNHKIELASEEGDVEILAGKNLLLQSGSSLFTTVGEDQQIEIGGSETLLTEEGDIQLNAGQDLMLDAAQNIQWRAEEGDINISTGADLLMESEGQRFDVINEGDYSLAVEQGSYLAEVDQDIGMTSASGNILLETSGGTLQISSEGDLLLEGGNIELTADSILVAGSELANN